MPSKTLAPALLPVAILSAVLSGAIHTYPADAAQPGRPVDPAATDDATLPLWEVGVGAGGGWLPHYPGSDEGSLRAIGAPYVIYRGDVFRVGDEGIARGRVVNTRLIEFDISLDGSFDAESDDNDARRGMPDLDFLAELGPQLIVKLHRSAAEEVDLAVQARAVLSSDLSNLNYRGLVYQVRLSYESQDFLGSGIGLVANAGPIFATGRLHDYFYAVDPAHATAERPAYDADGGYIGTEAFLGTFYKATDQLTLYAGAQVGIYSGAANKDSPLFREDLTAGILAGFTWSFWQSERRVRE
ncbi:MAG: hypothetical protein RLY86_3202 [Pseudomonadota bacterium]|jgi:outer membrane scaffolding protein for murein synthesis (MipA/OmpV family)